MMSLCTLQIKFSKTGPYSIVLFKPLQINFSIESNRYQASNTPIKNTARAVQFGKSIIVFEADIFYGHCTRVLYFRFTDTPSAIKLIKAVQSITHDLDLKQFSLWEDVTQCDGKFDWNELSKIGGEKIDREELVMIKPINPLLKPEMWKQAFKSMLL